MKTYSIENIASNGTVCSNNRKSNIVKLSSAQVYLHVLLEKFKVQLRYGKFLALKYYTFLQTVWLFPL